MEQTVNNREHRSPASIAGSLRYSGQYRELGLGEEPANFYSFSVMPLTVALVLFVTLASGLDALFTLLHIESGATEMNPIMNFALGHGVGFFLAAKVALTSIGCCFLALHQHFRLGREGLRWLTIAYTVLLVYHATIFLAQ